MKYCLDCGLEIVGRLDKMYCSDYCRSHYHNLLNKSRKNAVKEINVTLRKNAGILEKLDGYGITSISFSSLQSAGFDFNYFTHQVISAEGKRYNCCYSYGYHMLNEGEVLINRVSSLISSFKAE